MRQADEERFAALISWSKTHGGTLHPALEVYKDGVTGFSMRVRQGLRSDEEMFRPGDEILTCPLQTSLSYLNAITGQPLLTSTDAVERAEASPAFPPAFMALPPHVIGRFYLIQQYLLGASSLWHPYIATLPQPDALGSWSLPPFWPEDDAVFLEGTNTGIAAEQIREQLKREFKEARRALKDAGFSEWQEYTRLLHNWAFSIFASRSFRPSLVMPKAVRNFELPSTVGVDDFSVLLPVFDIINHDMKAQMRWLVDHNSSHARLCRFQTFDTYRPGDQVFNSYGKKTNSELLLSYGFVIPETEEVHNDYVHVRTKAAAGGGEQVVAGAGPVGAPQDFLVGLRPMNHPSSYVGQYRQKVAKSPDFTTRSEFANVEDSLIWDLCSMVTGEHGKSSLMNDILNVQPESVTFGSEATVSSQKREAECLRRVLSSSVALPEVIDRVVEQVKQVLLAKLGMEYDKLCETSPGISADDEGNEIIGDVQPQTPNQRLALQYRLQLKRVLENAISTLAPDWQDGATEEETG